MVIDKLLTRPTCTQTWESDGMEAHCERYAVVSVDGERYCAQHASDAPITDR